MTQSDTLFSGVLRHDAPNRAQLRPISPAQRTVLTLCGTGLRCASLPDLASVLEATEEQAAEVILELFRAGLIRQVLPINFPTWLTTGYGFERLQASEEAA